MSYLRSDEYHLLPRQELSGHLYPDTFSPKVHVTLDTLTSVSGHSMLSDNWIQTPVSLTPVSTRNQDTCFPTPVSRHLFPRENKTPVSRHLFPPGNKTPVSRHLFPRIISRHLFPDTCFLPKKSDTCFPTLLSLPKNQTPVSGRLFPTFFVQKKCWFWSMTKRVSPSCTMARRYFV